MLPGAHGRSAAAGVALAITLAHPKRSVVAGQRATLHAMCAALGGCELGDYWTSVHDRDDADVDETVRDPEHLPIDDAGWAVRVLSVAIEPAVHAVIEGMLICLSPALCATHCDVCNEWVGMGNASSEDVLRAVELRLHASTKRATRSVLDCVASFECLSEVATEVAETLGDARELPATVRLEQVARANHDLLEGVREEATQNSSWQVRRPARIALLRAHIASVQAGAQLPIGADDAATGDPTGRRLKEEEARIPTPLTRVQLFMQETTNRTCYMLALKNATGAHDSHVQSTNLWMHLSGGGNDGRGQGRICVDCQFPNFTTSCRGHFAHVGRSLVKLRLQAERPPATSHQERKRRLMDHTRAHLNNVCCAIKDGVEECHEKYCVMHVRNSMKLRATHVARKMTEQEHPSAVEHFGVATQLGLDTVNPSLHHDPSCRVDNATEASRLECMGRSILHHLSARHGLSYENARQKLDEFGVNIGETLAHIARATGNMRAARGQVKSAFFEKQGRDASRAEALMDESRRRTERKAGAGAGAGAGRRLGEEREPFGGHGLGQHALHAGSMRQQMQNASAVMHGAMMAMDRAATASNNRHLREGRQAPQQYQPRPNELQWHTLTHGMPSPITAILAVGAEEGSYASRFGGAIVQLNALRDRVQSSLSTTRRRLSVQHTGRHRQLSPNAAHAEKLYLALEASQASQKAPPLELPTSHSLSWVHELVDWDHTLQEGSRLFGVLRARHAMRAEGAEHAEIVRAHPTGYGHMDDAARSRPSVLGDAMRRLLYRAETSADPPWHAPSVMHRVDRRLQEARGARGAGEDSVAKGSHLRRLGVAFFEATIAAPFAFWDTLMPSGLTAKGSEITFWEATLRYIVSSTVGCYFVAPVKETSKTQGEDGAEGGDALLIARPSEEKLCFPSFPFAFPPIPAFRVATKTEGVDPYALNYMDYCAGDNSAMQQTADVLEALGIDPRSENPLLPNAALLRSAEAVDAVLNAASSGQSDVPNAMNAGRILCSICQLGGLIYFSLLGIIVLVLINLLPAVNFVAQLLFDGCVVVVTAVTEKRRLPAKRSRLAAVAAPFSRGGGGGGGGGSAATSSASVMHGAANVDKVHLTAQQLRAMRRQHAFRFGRADVTSFGYRARQIGRSVVAKFRAVPAESASLLRDDRLCNAGGGGGGPKSPQSPQSPPLEKAAFEP